jgi:hypothetical protein
MGTKSRGITEPDIRALSPLRTVIIRHPAGGFGPVELVSQVGPIAKGFIMGTSATTEGIDFPDRVPFTILPSD